jgi:hypothetical protein
MCVGLVDRAEDWHWSSLPVWLNPPLLPWLDPGPVPRHPGWLEYVQMPHTEAELGALRCCAERGRPYGSPAWGEQTAERLGLESTLHATGRPPDQGSPATEYAGVFGPQDF